MMVRFYRPWAVSLAPIALIACTNPGTTVAEPRSAAPLGIDLGGSGPVAAAGASEGHASRSLHSGDMQMAQANPNDAHGIGTVNSVDTAQRKINLSHQPISELGWPAMTMEFPVAPAVDLRAIKPGSLVNFTIEQGQGGMYQIQAIAPAGGGQ